jgi:Ca2+:H+ antiporter
VTRWTTLVPPAALVALAIAWLTHPEGPAGVTLVAVFLIGAVLAAVHHAEVVAHRVGDPLGSLILAVAVTVIEVALIVTLMVGDPVHGATLARDTVFAAVMLSLNGIVGFSLLVAALRHHLAVFNPEGTGSALATVITLAGLTLVLPRFTTSESGPEFAPSQLAFAAVVSLAGLTLVLPTFTTSNPGPEFTSEQLAFAAIASLALYVLFVFTQTVRHRDFFLPPQEGASYGRDAAHDTHDDDHPDHPSNRETLVSLALLLAALVAVVGLAKVESKPLEKAVNAAGLPQEIVGVVIAALVLLPEAISAVRAAADDRMQVSFNLAYGSAIASIGLTIPTIALAKVWLDGPLVLGLQTTQIVLLVLSAIVGILTVVPGRSKPLQGGLHLVLLATFVFVSIAP